MSQMRGVLNLMLDAVYPLIRSNKWRSISGMVIFLLEDVLPAQPISSSLPEKRLKRTVARRNKETRALQGPRHVWQSFFADDQSVGTQCQSGQGICDGASASPALPRG